MKVCVTMKLIIHANFESDTSKFCKAMDYRRQIVNFHTNKLNFYLFYRALHEILTRIHIAENR